MQKIFLTAVILIISSFVHAEDNKTQTHIQKTNAVMQKEIPAEHKNIANDLLEKRKQLPDNIQQELEAFSNISKNESRKAYKALSADAKKTLKEERALKKNLSKEAKKNINLLLKNFKATSTEK